jgi:hypothetical protein
MTDNRILKGILNRIWKGRRASATCRTEYAKNGKGYRQKKKKNLEKDDHIAGQVIRPLITRNCVGGAYSLKLTDVLAAGKLVRTSHLRLSS